MKDLFKTSVVTIIAFVMICTSICFATPSSEKLTGENIWFGVLKFPDAEFRLAIEIFRKADGTLAAELISLDQGDTGIPVNEFSLENGTARFVINAAGLVIEGPIDGKDLTINAQFKQGQESLPLVLKTVEELPARPPRKQEPVKPYPYIEEAVVFDNPEGGVKLSGTLTKPRSQGPHPAVLLVAGAGPMDRNEKALDHKPFLVLSDYLTRNGFAVLRYDKRGVSRSTGDFYSATKTDFAGDALAGFRYLRSRPDIDPGALGIIGHSEGGEVASIVAVQSSDVSYLVLLGAPGISFYDILTLQDGTEAKAGGKTDEDVELIRGFSRRFYTIVLQSKDASEIERETQALYTKLTDAEKKALDWPNLKGTLNLSWALDPGARKKLEFDIRPTLRKVLCPVIALNGEKDCQVPPRENLGGIEKELKAGGNKNFTVCELPGLNHMFQTCSTGAVSEYIKIEETMAPIAQDTITQWIIGQTGRSVQSK